MAVLTSAAHEASLSLIAKKQSAADFNAEEAPMSSYVLNGVDYTAARSVKVCTINRNGQHAQKAAKRCMCSGYYAGMSSAMECEVRDCMRRASRRSGRS